MIPADTRRWQMVALVALFGYLLWLLAPVLTPFVIAALLAWLGDPLVDRIERAGRSRTIGVLLVFTLMLLMIALILILLIPMLEREIGRLFTSLPAYRDWFMQKVVPWIEQKTRIEVRDYIDPAYLIEMIKQYWQEAGGVAANVLGTVSRSGFAVLAWLANIVLVPIVTFYFLRDWDLMVEQVRRLLPRDVEPTVVKLARESDAVLGGFLRGQLSVMVALGTIYAVGLWLVGIDLAFLIGLVAGLISFVPYLGTFVGMAMAVIAALVQHGDWLHVALVLTVFGAGQMLEGYVLTPKLVGDRIGLPPVAVIFAVMAGGQLFGFLGVLLALPVAAVTMVLLRYLHERYTASELYAGDPPLEGPLVVVESHRSTDAEAGDAKGDDKKDPDPASKS